MKKLVMVAQENTNYKPLLDARDILSTEEVLIAIATAARAGDEEKVTELAKILLTLNERNEKALYNEKLILQIMADIAGEIEPGDILCEAETFDFLSNEIRVDYRMSLNILFVRAALMRFCEKGTMKRSRAKVRREDELEERWRVIYTVL